MNVEGNALWFLTPENKIRVFSVRVVEHENFDNAILFLIMFSTLCLCWESPLFDPKDAQADNLYYIDIVVTILFTFEMVFKIIVFGFAINGKESYIRSAWNLMDFVIVASSFVSLSLRGSNVSALKMLRMLRVLRPLRMISRNQGLKIAVSSLVNSLPYIRDVIVVSLLFLLLFAILCTNFYKGAFFSCLVNEDIFENMPEAVSEEL